MQKMKIVLVEDDEILSRVLTEELRDAGFEVVQAFDGEEGVAKVSSEKPDVVLLDILMPKKDGFETLKELKSSPVTETIPVIVLTMLGRDEDIKKGLLLGAADYIVKSQHAVAEICDKVKEFFKMESHPGEGGKARKEKEEERSVAEAKKQAEDALERERQAKQAEAARRLKEAERILTEAKEQEAARRLEEAERSVAEAKKQTKEAQGP